MSSDRYVDKIVAIKPRPVEMQVLCLGLSRTSTMTMHASLNMLGYKTYHMKEALVRENRKEKHINCWLEALNFKVRGIGKPSTAADFDKILQHYSAVTDMPCVNFSDELVKAFPNAKVVLTKRDPEAWLKSMDHSIYRILRWKIWPFLRYIDPEGLCAFHDCIQLAIGDWTSPKPWNDRDALGAHMADHVAHIRAIVPAENLLEFHPRDGWEPLCKFLGKDVPAEEPFPYVNKGDNTANLIKIGVTTKIFIILARYLAWNLPIIGVVWYSLKWLPHDTYSHVTSLFSWVR